MTPQRLVDKLLAATGHTFNIVADDDGSGRVKVQRNVGDYRYVFRYIEEDDTKCTFIIKDRNRVNEHRSKQRTRKALGMCLAHIANPTPAFKLLYREQEAGE